MLTQNELRIAENENHASITISQLSKDGSIIFSKWKSPPKQGFCDLACTTQVSPTNQ